MNGERPRTSTFTLVRRSILLAVGVFGLLCEILTPADARPILLVTDLILVGVLPIELFLARRAPVRDNYDPGP